MKDTQSDTDDDWNSTVLLTARERKRGEGRGREGEGAGGRGSVACHILARGEAGREE